jgi:hypothetical protein
MFRLAPGAEDHFIALRTALGVFLPLTLLIAIDRMDWPCAGRSGPR